MCMYNRFFFYSTSFKTSLRSVVGMMVSNVVLLSPHFSGDFLSNPTVICNFPPLLTPPNCQRNVIFKALSSLLANLYGQRHIRCESGRRHAITTSFLLSIFSLTLTTSFPNGSLDSRRLRSSPSHQLELGHSVGK